MQQTTESPPVRIVQLTAENVKRLRAVTIRPDGTGLIEITGRNAQGKTSVLDAIEMALGGSRSIPPEPIRRGESSARVVLDLGDITVERIFGEGGSTLTVKGKDGARFPSPQAMLDKLVGSLTFDPLAFTRMKPADQRTTLMNVAGVSFDDLEAARKVAFDERTMAGRTLKRVTEQLAGMPDVQPRPARVDVTALNEEYRAACDLNNAATLAEQSHAAANDYLGRANDTVVRLERELAAARVEAGKAKIYCDEMKKKFDDAVSKRVNTESITERIRTAQGANDAAGRAEQRDAKVIEVNEAKAAHDALDQKIVDLEAAKLARLAEAKIPIDGLGIGEVGVIYNGLPFEQASGAEQLKVSIAMAAALNPKLRVMLIRDGSLLDDQSMQTLAEVAQGRDLQVWIERVETNADFGVVIEDGEVVNTAALNAAAAAPQPA